MRPPLAAARVGGMRLTVSGLLASLLCGGCAGSQSPADTAPMPTAWTTYGAPVAGVKPGPDSRRLPAGASGGGAARIH